MDQMWLLTNITLFLIHTLSGETDGKNDIFWRLDLIMKRLINKINHSNIFLPLRSYCFIFSSFSSESAFYE